MRIPYAGVCYIQMFLENKLENPFINKWVFVFKNKCEIDSLFLFGLKDS